MPMIGRVGSATLAPVTSSRRAWAWVSVPRLKPIQTLPSLVPTIASLDHLGEYLTWLMNERSPSVPFVMSWVVGLFVTYQVTEPLFAAVTVSPTRYVPSPGWPQPGPGPGAWQSSPPGIPPWKMSNG